MGVGIRADVVLWRGSWMGDEVCGCELGWPVLLPVMKDLLKPVGLLGMNMEVGILLRG